MSLSGTLVCFFATIVVAVAILFIAWLVRFRETGVHMFMGTSNMQCINAQE